MRALAVAMGVVLLALPGGVGASSHAAARPNIVVVVVDDMPAMDDRLLEHMPTVKQFDVTLAELHVASNLCCPSRASMLTGLWPHEHRVTGNRMGPFDPEESVAVQLAQAGYVSGMFGKVLNAYGECALYWCKRVFPGFTGWAGFSKVGYNDYTLLVGKPDGTTAPQQPDVYSTDELAARADAFIRSANREKPVFVWFAPYAPHAQPVAADRHHNAPCDVEPWTPPSWNEADVSDKPAYVRTLPLLKQPTDLTVHCRTLLAVDDAVARIRSALTATRRLKNTLIVFLSDNGMHAGEHRLTSKVAPYATRVTARVDWPARFSPRVVTEPVSTIDLAATLCDAAGCQMRGESFLPLLAGTATFHGEDVLFSEMLVKAGIGVYHGVRTKPRSPRGDWHYVEYATGERELYDISGGPCWTWQPGEPGDPCELSNLAGKPGYANIAAVLHAELERLKAICAFAKCLAPSTHDE